MSYKACSISKAKQLAINKHVDDSKKAKKAGERIFSYWATIKLPRDSGNTITNRNCHIIMDQYTGYKELEFYSTKSSFWNQCEKI